MLLLSFPSLILLLIRKTVSELIKSNDFGVGLSRGPRWIITLSPPLISFNVLRAHRSSIAITTSVSASHQHALTRAHIVHTLTHRNNPHPRAVPAAHCSPSTLYVGSLGNVQKVIFSKGKSSILFIALHWAIARKNRTRCLDFGLVGASTLFTSHFPVKPLATMDSSMEVFIPEAHKHNCTYVVGLYPGETYTVFGMWHQSQHQTQTPSGWGSALIDLLDDKCTIKKNCIQYKHIRFMKNKV